MAVIVEGAGVPLACVERGDGPDVLLIHDIASDAEAVAPIAHALSADHRVIAYDRRGYGGSGAPTPYEATTVHEQAEDAAALLAALGGHRTTVVGLGFGALIALDLLTRHGGLLGAAVLADPPLFAFVAEATEALAAERQVLEDALREGGPALAVERWLGEDADPKRVARAREHAVAFFADLAGLATWPVTRGRLRAVDVPAVVLTREDAPRYVAGAADAVAGLMPRARRELGGDVAAAVRGLR